MVADVTKEQRWLVCESGGARVVCSDAYYNGDQENDDPDKQHG